jgi:uncharacterized protein (DUF433 family)
MSDAAIWIDPARQCGAPCIYGTRIPVETIALFGVYDGVDRAMSAYGITRRQVLVACAWWTLNIDDTVDTLTDSDLIRDEWYEWAEHAWQTLTPTTDETAAGTPDPPPVNL